MISAALLLALAPASPPAATISAIHADARRFAGKRVVLRGWINRCNPLDCSLLETADGGEGLSLESNARVDAQLAALVPTWVELEAVIDPVCIGGSEVCLDRAPQLRDVLLRSILATPAPPEDQ